jgi:hypothetical protein
MTPTSTQHFDARRILAWGATWALAVAVVEALAFSPAAAWGSIELLLWWFFYWTVPFWCIVGCSFVWLAAHGERYTGRRGQVVSFIVTCILAGGVQPLLSTGLMELTKDVFPSANRFAQELGVVPGPSNWLALALYDTWLCLFYGGLLMAVCGLTLRTERMRYLLHANAMASSRTEALLDAERLQALQAQIDPNLLLDSLYELEQRYRIAPASAERLLETLVEFLRDAMQGLRDPVSTIAAEVRLAKAFANLQRERGQEGAWRVVDPESSVGCGYKFPSLLMLPLLALGGEGGRPLLRVEANQHSATLSVYGLSRGVSSELLQQLRVRLQALYGGRFEVEPTAAAGNGLLIALSGGSTHMGGDDESGSHR